MKSSREEIFANSSRIRSEMHHEKRTHAMNKVGGRNVVVLIFLSFERAFDGLILHSVPLWGCLDKHQLFGCDRFVWCRVFFLYSSSLSLLCFPLLFMLVTVMSVSISMHCLCVSMFFRCIFACTFFPFTNASVAMELSRINSPATNRKNRTLINTLFSSIEWKQIVAAGVLNQHKENGRDTRLCDVHTSHYKPYEEEKKTQQWTVS